MPTKAPAKKAVKKATTRKLVEGRKGQPARRRKLPRQRLESVLDEFLKNQHCTLYGRAFDIYEDESREECAAFLADVIEGVWKDIS